MIILYEDAVLREINRDHLMRIRGQMIDTDPLYVLFTSGSSGMPKGTVLSHRSVISYTTWVSEQFEFGADTVFRIPNPTLFLHVGDGSVFNHKVRKYVPYDPKDVFYLPDKAGGISQRAKDQYHLLGAVGAGHRIQLERIRFCQAGAFAENPLCRRGDAGEAPQLLAKIPAGLSVRQPVRADRDDGHLQFLRGGSKLCRQ